MAIGPSDKKGKPRDPSPTREELVERDRASAVDDASTYVDLGDDLLEKTAVDSSISPARGARADPLPPPTPARRKALSRSPPKTKSGSGDHERASPTSEEIHDRVQSARILFSEGLIEEAKKTARQVLIDDPKNAFASQLLADIYKLELKQIFGGGTARRNVYAPKEEAPSEDLSRIDASGIMHRLDQDLKLGFFDEEGAEAPIAQLSIFADEAEMDRFGERVDRELRAASLTDRLDVGICFLEMGLHSLAERQFRQVYRRARPAWDTLVSSAALLAYVLILSGQAFDASLVLQPVLQEHEVALKSKVELFYLMGRAQEMLHKPDLAAEWYLQVREHDPFYRDIEERLRRIERQPRPPRPEPQEDR